MNASKLLAPFRDLVDRRLWPVAVLLVLVAVAAPFVLSTPDEPAAPVTGAPAAGEGVDAASIVAVAEPDASRRRVLGARKDPFTPTGRQPKAASTSTSTSSTSTSANPFGGGASADGSTGSGGSTGGSTALPTPAIDGPIAPVPTAPTDATTPDYLPLYSLRVVFDEATRTVKRLDALPDADTPLAIYLGVADDEKSAVFLLDETVRPDGDGRCYPAPGDCQRLYLKAGETEFLDVAAAEGEEAVQHELHLSRIVTSRRVVAPTDDAATTPTAAASSLGRRALRARFSRVGRLRYDRRTGVLRKITPAAYRAEQARARAARR